jgi:cytochrome c553
LFDGAIILNERWPWSPDGYPEHATPSAAWFAGFEAFKRGEQLALPYHGGRATDPDKQATLSEAYRRYREGTLSAEALPDLADIFPDDPQERAEMGLQNEPTASPAQLLVQACGTCHNDVLDQDISRARFNIALGRLAPKERAVAVSRLTRPRGTAGAMPPADARQLDSDALAALQAYLEQDSRTDEDDELLEHAAQRGMAGPQLRNAATRPQLGGL